MPEVKVRIVPNGPDLILEAGEALMAGALRLGYRWPTVCGGIGDCMVCKVRVVSGHDVVSPESSAETHRLRGLRLGGKPQPEPWRLACQMRVNGDVVVEKRGVKPQS
jgi:2Fe-2S ferredoxin